MVLHLPPLNPPPIWFPKLRLLSTALYLFLSLFSLVVGLSDAFGGQEFGDRTMGVSFALASVVLVAAILDLWWPKSEFSIAALGGVVAALISATMAGAQWSSLEHDARLWVWLGLAFLSIACVALFILAKVPLNLKGVGSFVSVGVAVTLLQFWYTNQYVPSKIDPTLTINSQVTSVSTVDPPNQPAGPNPPGQPSAMRQLSISVVAKNTSKTKVLILGSVIRVIGVNFMPVDLPPQAWADELRDTSGQARRLDRHAWESGAAVIMTDSIIEEGRFLSPEQEVTIRYITVAPPDRYAVARVETKWILSRGERLVLGPEQKDNAPSIDRNYNEEYFGKSWPIEESSTIKRITRCGFQLRILWLWDSSTDCQRRVLWGWYFRSLEPGAEALGYPDVFVSLNREGLERGSRREIEYRRKFERLYGLTEVRSLSEASLNLTG